MNRALMKEFITRTSPRFQARVAYVYYLFTILTGIIVILVGNRLNFLVDIIATAFYVGVTALFYALTKERKHSA